MHLCFYFLNTGLSVIAPGPAVSGGKHAPSSNTISLTSTSSAIRSAALKVSGQALLCHHCHLLLSVTIQELCCADEWPGRGVWT